MKNSYFPGTYSVYGTYNDATVSKVQAQSTRVISTNEHTWYSMSVNIYTWQVGNYYPIAYKSSMVYLSSNSDLLVERGYRVHTTEEYTYLSTWYANNKRTIYATRTCYSTLYGYNSTSQTYYTKDRYTSTFIKVTNYTTYLSHISFIESRYVKYTYMYHGWYNHTYRELLQSTTSDVGYDYTIQSTDNKNNYSHTYTYRVTNGGYNTRTYTSRTTISIHTEFYYSYSGYYGVDNYAITWWLSGVNPVNHSRSTRYKSSTMYYW